ncbi:MAG: hypothetical protein NUV55_10560 [Sulfuricaulis sp.]|uniref:hypothetical protein n=1 Tax=Sulfuricaulis sp. TaxID=2003553 RepID=UPI0025EA73FF|nr:hypothetical protein [Sulfuricaulis sp.]MCR4347624.1 hypothetical protein [Sulfuricaulis sp.]
MYTAIRLEAKLLIMLHWFLTELKTIGRSTLALAGVLWLIAAGAPCVMAQTSAPDSVPSHCPEHAKHNGAGHAVMPDCGPVTAINCQLPDTGTPLAASLGDFAMTPVLLVTLPVPVMLSDNGQQPRPDFFAPDIHAPPLHIRYLKLIL